MKYVFDIADGDLLLEILAFQEYVKNIWIVWFYDGPRQLQEIHFGMELLLKLWRNQISWI